MYYYIYDSFLEHPRYRKILDRLEFRLADLGITGEVARVRPLMSVKEIVGEGLTRGKRTIIALGNDHTFTEVVNTILNQDKVPSAEIICGFIPVDKPNSIGESLGITEDYSAPEIISRRIIKTIDLGRISKHYFLTRAVIGFGSRPSDWDKDSRLSFLKALRYHPREVILKLDDKFQLRLDLFQASFVNLSTKEKASPLASPEDDVLNVLVITKFSKFSLWKNLKLINAEQYYSLPRTSIFKAKRIEVVSAGRKNFNILADNRKIGHSPVVVEVAPRKLRVIVGKERIF